MKDMAENMQGEQSLKLQAMEAVAMDIKVDIQERVLKMEETDRCQQLEFEKVQQKFEENVNTTWEQIKVSGLGIKPSVLFNIRDVSDYNPDSGDTLRFSYVLSNTDSVYDISTGLFTAPVNGTYWFSVQLCNTGNGQISFRIVHNNEELSDSTTFQQTMCSSSNVVVELVSGDTVSVTRHPQYGRNRYYRSALISSSTYGRSAFMGALVH